MLQENSKKILLEKLKKENFKLTIDLNNKIPVIINEIIKEIPVTKKVKTFFKEKILNKIPNNNKKEENKEEENKEEKILEEEKEKNKEIFENLKEVLNWNNNNKSNFKLNYQFLLSWFNYDSWGKVWNNKSRDYSDDIIFFTKDNDFFVNTKDEEYKILGLIDGKVVVKIEKIEEKFEETIDRNRFKVVSAVWYSSIEKYLLDTEKQKIFSESLTNITWKSLEIQWKKFVQFECLNKATFYVCLEDFKILEYGNSSYLDIDTSKIFTINWKNFVNATYDYDEKRYTVLNISDLDIENEAIKIGDKAHKKDIIKNFNFDNVCDFNWLKYIKVDTHWSFKKHLNEKWKFLEDDIIKGLWDKYKYCLQEIIEIKNGYVTFKFEKNEKSFSLIFDWKKVLKESWKKDLKNFIVNLEKIEWNEKFYNWIVLWKNWEEKQRVLNENYEVIYFNMKKIIKLWDKSFEYLWEKYSETYVKWYEKPIFVKLKNSESEYSFKDKFVYENYRIIDWKNEWENLKLMLENKDWKETSVTISSKEKEKVGIKKFFGNFLK